MRSSLTFLALGSMVLGIACASRVELPEATSSAVTAAISAATLGNDCGYTTGGAGLTGDCAEPAAPSSSDAGTPGAERGGCGGGCQQSNVQLALANGGKSKAAIAVVEVHLLDATTSERLDDVDAKNARVWGGSSYTPWDSSLAAGANAKVTYDMTQIDWTKIGGGNAWNTYSRRYKLEIVLRVDGADRTLVSGELSREPEVVTQALARPLSAG